MNLMGDNWVRTARWLMVTLTAFVIVAQPLLGRVREPVAKPGACCNKCECCVASDSGGTSKPAAPAPTRAAVAKDLQLVPVLHAPLLPTTVRTPVSFASPAFGSSISVPVFIRHCTFLI